MKLLWQVVLFLLRVLARVVVYAFIERWIPLDQPLFGEAKATTPKPAKQKQPKQKREKKKKGRAQQRPRDDERLSEGGYDVRFSRDRDSVMVDWSEPPPAPRKKAAVPADPGRHPLVRNGATVRDALVLSAALSKRRVPFR